MSEWRLTYLHQKPGEVLWHIRRKLDEALKRLTDERAYRPTQGLKGYYPDDSRVVPEMAQNLYPIRTATQFCSGQINYYQEQIKAYEEHLEYLGAMDYLFQREIDIAMGRRKP